MNVVVRYTIIGIFDGAQRTARVVASAPVRGRKAEAILRHQAGPHDKITRDDEGRLVATSNVGFLRVESA